MYKFASLISCGKELYNNNNNIIFIYLHEPFNNLHDLIYLYNRK